MSRIDVSMLAVIRRLSEVISRNLRENFAVIRTAQNDTEDRIDTIITPVAGNSISNGTFDSSTGWTLGTGATIGSGLLTWSGAQVANSDTTQASALVVGQTYITEFTVSNYTAGNVRLLAGTATGTNRAANGTYTETIVCTANTTATIRGDLDFAGSIDNVRFYSHEIADARDNETTLRHRLIEATRPIGNVVVEGFDVAEQGTPDMTVQVSAGKAVVNGVVVNKTTSTNTGTITAPTNNRYDVVVINDDNSISVVTGNDAAEPELPDCAISQRPLAVIYLTSASTTISTADIRACKDQGVSLTTGGTRPHWFWKIQSAFDELANLFDDDFDVTGSYIKVGPGVYIEEEIVPEDDLDGFTLDLGSSVIKRATNTRRCLDFGSVTGGPSNFKIIGGVLDGNGKAGSLENANFQKCTNFSILGIDSQGNSGSSATYKDILFNDNDNFFACGSASSEDDGIGDTSNTERVILFGGGGSASTNLTVQSFSLSATTGGVNNLSARTLFGTYTVAQIFSALDPFIPNTGDRINLHGNYCLASTYDPGFIDGDPPDSVRMETRFPISVERTDATTLTIREWYQLVFISSDLTNNLNTASINNTIATPQNSNTIPSVGSANYYCCLTW